MVFCDLFSPFHSPGSASASAAGVGSSAVAASEPSEVGSSVAAVAGILCPWRRRWKSSSSGGGSSKAAEWG